MTYERDDDIKRICEELIETLDCDYMRQIRNAQPNIAYRTCDTEKKKNGAVVHADCEKVKPSNKQYMAYDYIITVYPKNCEYMTEEQMQVLLYHELLHIDCDRNDAGELSCKIRQHDIQDFMCITQKYGEYWSEECAEVKSIYEVIGCEK